MKKSKLLFVSNLFPDADEPYRGLDNATLLHHLSEQYEIRVLSPRPTLPLTPFKTRRCREADEKFAPVYLPAPYVPKAGSHFNHTLMARALRPVMIALRGKFPFEAVFCSWVFPDGCAVAKLACESGLPFAVVAQGSDVHQYLNIPARKKIIVESMGHASALITRSGELGRLLNDAGIAKDKLHTIYNGIDFQVFQPGDRVQARRELGLPPEARIILFVGNFFEIKNPLLLVQAHAEFCRVQPTPECHLVMIGGGPLEGEIRALANSSGFGGQVVIAGRKTAGEVARAMQAADFLCLPSENEGVPNVILEAFACGLRVVASRVGGIPEVLSDDSLGRLAGRGSLPDLLDAFTELFACPPQRDAIRRHALYFSWERAAAQYDKILDQMRR